MPTREESTPQTPVKYAMEIERVQTGGGNELLLHKDGSIYIIRVDGVILMSSRQHSSEEDMAQLGLDALPTRAGARVLIGGLGMGYTLRATLDLAPQDAEIVVAEVFDAVVRWNREVFGHLAGAPLKDPRVEVYGGDVQDALHTKGPFDLVLLDVDNGPHALTLPSNSAIYSKRGLDLIAKALSPTGVAVVWSALPDDAFVARSKKCGFYVKSHSVRSKRTRRGQGHIIFLLRRTKPARRGGH